MPDDLIHIRRTPLPWRGDDGLTECGRTSHPETSQTRDEAVAGFKQLGQTRFAMVTCMTCMQRAEVRHRVERDDGILPVLGREIQRVTYSRHHEELDRLTAEMEAIAALIAAHQDEFSAYLAAKAETTDLTARRRRAR